MVKLFPSTLLPGNGLWISHGEAVGGCVEGVSKGKRCLAGIVDHFRRAELLGNVLERVIVDGGKGCRGREEVIFYILLA